jgi:hypothetical protein
MESASEKNVRLVMVFKSGRAASLVMADSQARDLMQRILDGEDILSAVTITLHSESARTDYPAYTSMIRGSEVSHAAIFTLDDVSPLETNEFAAAIAPYGFYDTMPVPQLPKR